MNVLRIAGYNERRCIARDVLCLYGSIVTIARYDITEAVSQDQWHQILASAVQRCIHRHIALSVVVKDASTEKPLLAKLDKVNAAAHLTTLDIQDEPDDTTETLASLLHVAHARRLDDYETRPQWQVFALPIGGEKCIKSTYIAFASSHVIMDGRSGTIFHRSLLQALNDEDYSDSIADLAPALDQAATFPISWSFLLRPLIEEKLPTRICQLFGFAPSVGVWSGASVRPSRPRDGQLVQTAAKVSLVEATTLETLLTLCRAHGSKLTALLNYSVAQALAIALQKRDQVCDTFAASTPIDLRGLIPDAAGRMANYVSVVNQTLKVEKPVSTSQLTEFDWDHIRSATEVMQERSASLNDQPIALLQYLSNFKDWVSKRASQPAQESFSVSNLGNFGSSGDGDAWKISQMAFSQSADATGGPLNINVASSDYGPLCVVMTWWPGMLGVDDEVDFVAEVLRYSGEPVRGSGHGRALTRTLTQSWLISPSRHWASWMRLLDCTTPTTIDQIH